MNESVLKTLSKTILRTKEKKYSHKINGRWENQFIDMIHVPDVNKILNAACCEGKKLMNQSLVIPHKDLGFSRNEFWFNVTKPGDSTGWHDHKERAALSGVYYIDVPDGAPDLIIKTPLKANFDDLMFESEESSEVHKLKIETGDLVLFPGWLEHGVDANLTDKPRINIAFNFGIPELVRAFS